MVGNGEVAVLMPFPTVQTGQVADASISEPKLTEAVREKLNRAAGESVTYSMTLAEPLSAWSCVRADVNGHAILCTNAAECQQTLLGVTTQAGANGDAVTVIAQGRASDSSFARFPHGFPLFIAENGSLTPSPPARGYVQIVATVIAANEIAVLPGGTILQE